LSTYKLPEDTRIIHELLVETIDPNIDTAKLVWWVQLIESKPQHPVQGHGNMPCASQATFFRAHARHIASHVVIGRGKHQVRHIDYKHKSEFEERLNAVELKVDHTKGSMRFGPVSYIIMSPRSSGIGSFLMSQAIEWAMARWPYYRVENGTLGISDANTDQERDRRNAFYAKLNFDLRFPEDEQEKRVGKFTAARVDQLTPRWNPAKLQALAVDQLYAAHVAECKRADRTQVSLTAHENTLEILRSQLQSNYARGRRHFLAHVVCLGVIGVLLYALQRPH